MRIVLTGGGTAGHINPALAIADTFKKQYPNAEILFLGGKHGLEQELVTRSGYPITCFAIEGLKRSLSPANIRVLYRAIRAFQEAKKVLSEFNPDLVVGTGGYVCWPVLRAAASLNIPCALHESNAVLGVAAKSLLKTVDIMLVNYQETADACKCAKKAVCVGNPIRSDFSSHEKRIAKKRLLHTANRTLLLSFGGSLGATALNSAMLNLMESYSAKHEEIIHVHVTGKKGYQTFLEEAQAREILKYPNIKIYEYLYDLPAYLSAADLAICRAGAMTLSELALTATPAILVPSPNVTGNHQHKNAMVFAKAGAATICMEEDLSTGSLLAHVSNLLADQAHLLRMQAEMQKLAKPHANQEILSVLQQLLAKKP